MMIDPRLYTAWGWRLWLYDSVDYRQKEVSELDMTEINNLETDMSSRQKAELDKEKSKEERKEAKRAKKQHYRELNEPPKLTVLEEVGNAVTHGIGAGLAIAGFVLLLLKSDTGLKVMASCFYGISEDLTIPRYIC